MVYEPRNFPPSSRWTGGGDHLHYAEWAAHAANEVAARWSRGEPVADIVHALASSRGALAASMATRDASLFGAPRGRMSVTHLGNECPKLVQRARRGMTTLRRDWLLLELDWPLPDEVPRLSRTITYAGARGEAIEATQVSRYLAPVSIEPYEFAAGTLVLEHTVPARIGPILDDVIARLGALREGPAEWAERMACAAQAFFGFFHAMAYARGSSAIGRSLFAGVMWGLSGRLLAQVPPDLDLHALTALDQAEFERDFLRFTRTAGTWAGG